MFSMSALELAAAVKEKKLSVAEVVSAYIETTENTDNKHNSFLAVSKEYALESAREVQSRLESGETLSPLAGIPIALADNISTTGIETTCASKMLKGYSPVFSAAVVERLEQAGMVIIGKLNMDEFAMGSSGETGAFGPVKNPWDISRVAGGSSSGSAAAIAAGEAPLTLGSDTGGDLRQPCAFCGVTGIKPTYGAVSRFGLIANASSFDQIGPAGRNMDDCAALLSIISGADGRDGTCVLEKPYIFDKNPAEHLDGVRIGLPGNLMTGIAEDVKGSVLAAAREFQAAGAIVEEFEMPLVDCLFPAWYIIACAEASSNLGRYDGLKYGYRSGNARTLSEVYRLSRGEGFGLEVKRRIMFGALMLSSGCYDTYFSKAMRARTVIMNACRKLLLDFDMLLFPVVPDTAHGLGETAGSPMNMFAGAAYNVLANLAGLPAASLPCGFDRHGLPIGFQLISSAFMEEKLIFAARTYQSRTVYHNRLPCGQGIGL